jgi:hypothetical protein
LYTTVVYTDHILLPGSSLRFLPNQAYQTPPRFNAYDQSEAGDLGYETSSQFSFIPQPVDMTPTRATTKPDVEPGVGSISGAWFQKSILLQKPLITDFAKIVNIKKPIDFWYKILKNEFKQNSANQNDKSTVF